MSHQHCSTSGTDILIASTREEATRTAKRPKTTKPSPTTFVTWNCNGFTSRCKWDATKLQELLEHTESPDLICVQEARLKAHDAHTRDRPLASEYVGAVQEIIEGIFHEYRPVWSLANNKYAGTLTLVHRRLGLQEKASMRQCCAFSVDWAIDTLLSRFKATRMDVGLERLPPPPPPNSTKTTKAPKQTSMMSFFAPKTSSTTTSENKNGSTAATTSSFLVDRKHHPEGRFQFFCFDGMDVLQTYVPNNGTEEERFQRRRDWDQEMLQFLKDRKKILKHCQQSDRPLIWCGDMNVAREYHDGTHWEKREDGSLYEWWTDESKCYVGKTNAKSDTRRPEDTGMPSFTAAERRRFADLLKEGDFVDAWRDLHPSGVIGSSLDDWDRPNYTWRGHLARSGDFNAKFQGKGQRLDYFLLSPVELFQKVKTCDILGYGEKREGYFCGSDHCASILRLKNQVFEVKAGAYSSV